MQTVHEAWMATRERWFWYVASALVHCSKMHFPHSICLVRNMIPGSSPVPRHFRFSHFAYSGNCGIAIEPFLTEKPNHEYTWRSQTRPRCSAFGSRKLSWNLFSYSRARFVRIFTLRQWIKLSNCSPSRNLKLSSFTVLHRKYVCCHLAYSINWIISWSRWRPVARLLAAVSVSWSPHCRSLFFQFIRIFRG